MNKAKKIIGLIYVQYLLSGFNNATMTNLAEHLEGISHDQINRFFGKEKITPIVVWNNVRDSIIFSENGYILFDDTVIVKDSSYKIEMVRRQYSGNKKKIVKGIGVVTCLYVNAELNEYWEVDFRIYDPDNDGKSKHDHVRDMLKSLVHEKKIPFKTVLMDSWYACAETFLLIGDLKKVFYCPLPKNRKANDSGGKEDAKRVDSLTWSEHELKNGKSVKLRKLPSTHLVKLFRVVVSKNRTEFVVTNNCETQLSTDDARNEGAIRWKIEQLHRELKQLTGLEKCQCRMRRIQRNHIACSMLALIRLRQQAAQAQKSVYQFRNDLFKPYLKELLKNIPSMTLA